MLTVSEKLSAGNVKAAVRLLMSGEVFSQPSSKTLANLQAKHFPAFSDPHHPDAPTAVSVPPLHVAPPAVLKAILSFPPGSSGGPDVLSPTHIQKMVGDKSGGSALVEALSAFCNLVLAAKCPLEVALYFSGRHTIWTRREKG